MSIVLALAAAVLIGASAIFSKMALQQRKVAGMGMMIFTMGS